MKDPAFWLERIYERLGLVFPSALGQKTAAQSLSVVPASNDPSRWLSTDAVTTGVNSASVTVTTGYEWQLQWLRVSYVSSATIGNRNLAWQIINSGGQVIANFTCGTIQAASKTYTYLFAPGMPDSVAVRDSTFVSSPMPASMILPAGAIFRVIDIKSIDGSGDSMSLRYNYLYRPAAV